MTIQSSTLDILFRRISPSSVFDMLEEIVRRGGTKGSPNLNLFQKYAGSVLQGYSKDEIALIDDAIRNEAQKMRNAIYTEDWKPDHRSALIPLSQASMALHCVLILADRLLCQRNGVPFCKIEEVGEWRKTFLDLGQDLFVCALLAYQDLKTNYRRLDFTWPAILPTDHTGLNELLAEGVAENHQHLYGSSQTFALSWCSVMNFPEEHQKIGKAFDELYQPYVAIGPEKRFVTSRERVKYACFFRQFLFEWLLQNKDNGNKAECPCQNGAAECALSASEEDSPCRFRCPNGRENAWKWIHALDLSFPKVSVLRYEKGAKVRQRNGRTACLDYAYTKELYNENPEADYRALAGERYFLYLYFQAFFQQKTEERYDFLFYLYIILKTMFRSELIQVNRRVGFRNFSDYQGRKTDLCSQPFYQAELIRMAINAPLDEGHVSSLETRITPAGSPLIYKNRIRELDKLEAFAAQKGSQYSIFPVQSAPNSAYRLKNGKNVDPRYFYLIHFIKSPDRSYQSFFEREAGKANKALEKKKIGNLASCPEKHTKSIDQIIRPLASRHESLRKKIRCQAIVLSKALHMHEELRSRIRGIDCASHEIGCGPEVFAMAYRYLRGYQNTRLMNNLLLRSKPFTLSFTYHAGEDFYDILSALRSIDEAVIYLNMRRDDRIGHALGLGVDPTKHYMLKNYHIFLPKQKRLDDLIWLLNRCRDLGLHIDPHIYGKLKKEAELLFYDIYGHTMEAWNWNISLTEYFCSMSLRADDPVLYKEFDPECFMSKTHELLDDYDRFRYSLHSEALRSYRGSCYLYGLNHLYQYGFRERIKGNEPCEIVIDEDYIRLMRDAQNILQQELSHRGIIIECNPSSNVLIGTFREYKYHPIFRFNHTGLTSKPFSELKTAPLQVCVNTDDLGVFDTSLEFEYALLYDALRHMDHAEDEDELTEAQILNYLGYIRNLGKQAVFPPLGNR